jgi:hypothetical protein
MPMASFVIDPHHQTSTVKSNPTWIKPEIAPEFVVLRAGQFANSGSRVVDESSMSGSFV